jgi:hypothetical protein
MFMAVIPMDQLGPLVTIPRRDRLYSDLVFSRDDRAESCIVVLTDSVFAWRPVGWHRLPMAFNMPMEYYIIPLTAIRFVEIKGADSLMTDRFVRMHWGREKCEQMAFEFVVRPMRNWVKACLALAVPVLGAEKVMSIKGFLKDNWPYFWIGGVFVGIIVTAVFSNIVDRANAQRNVFVFFAIAQMVGMVIWIWLVVKRSYNLLPPDQHNEHSPTDPM